MTRLDVVVADIARLDVERRDAYQQWAAGVFQGRGRGLSDVLIRRGVPATLARPVARRAGRRSGGLPRDLRAEDWATLFAAVGEGS